MFPKRKIKGVLIKITKIPRYGYMLHIKIYIIYLIIKLINKTLKLRL